MTYSPYLIANYATGLSKRLQPWLIPDDAQETLLDGYVYRGTMSKRDGYKYFATGERGGSVYRESRIVHTLTAVTPTTGVIDGANATFTFTGTVQTARGSVIITGSAPAQVVTDNGLGILVGAGTGTVTYTTGAISVTFTAPPAALSTVLLTYSFMPANPVMMIALYVADDNTKELIVADTRYVNRYNATTNILEDISPATAYTGEKFDFFTWTNYDSATFTPRLLFCNNVDVIQKYDGTVVTDYVYTMESSAAIPVAITTLSCSFMVEMKDRLILLRTTENGTTFPKRIRISGTGANSDNFLPSTIGAGFIDIPDGTWINGAAFSRDDLIIFTEQATWALKYTGNDTTPFVLDRIDESRGCDATFSVFTYLNRTTAASKRGLIISDGYRVEREDEDIPDFTFNEIDNEAFKLCFSGVVDADRDHYLIYPPQNQPLETKISKRILTTNYDEDNFSIYRLPLSCMGTFIESFNTTWNDLLIYTTWPDFSSAYSDWNSFAYSKGVPFSLGGGHKGEIWKLGNKEGLDNQVRIRNVTVIDDLTVEVTTDWNNFSKHDADDEQDMGADLIFLTGMTGMSELNDQQFPITFVVNNNTFQINIQSATTPPVLGSNLTPYVSGGTAQRVIPFYSQFKQFNPFIEQDKKVRCGWLYMYVDSTKTILKRKIGISDITQSNPAVVTTETASGFSTGEQVEFFGIVGMTEINGTQPIITVLTPTTFSLNGVDSTGFTAYTSGGYASVYESSKLLIQVLTNSRTADDFTQLQNQAAYPYQGNMTNLTFEDGAKKWYKIFINQTGNFIQFVFRHQQAGGTVNIQATMPGFQPVGRLL